jgi:hypothetical protein
MHMKVGQSPTSDMDVMRSDLMSFIAEESVNGYLKKCANALRRRAPAQHEVLLDTNHAVIPVDLPAVLFRSSLGLLVVAINSSSTDSSLPPPRLCTRRW